MYGLRLIFGVLVILVSGCTDRSFTPTVPQALGIGTPKTIFAATNREPLKNGNYGAQRSADLNLLELTVSIPPEHKPGTLKFGYAKPDPESEFTMAGRHSFADEAAFAARLRAELAKVPPNERDVTVFVHGYNSTQAETAFRAAQLTHDIDIPGATVIFSWPSMGRALGYAYDADSVLYSRDGLEHLLRSLRHSGARRVVVVAHSMGGLLTMETLRQIEIRTPGWTANSLGGVILMSPDLDVDVFHSQIQQFAKVPQPFLVFVSRKDNVLTLSQRLRGHDSRGRLGNLNNIDDVSDLPIEIIDTTAFADEAESQHFVAATSPALVALLNGARETSDTFSHNPDLLRKILPGQIIVYDNAVRVDLDRRSPDDR